MLVELIYGRNRDHTYHLKTAPPAAFGRRVSAEVTVPLWMTHHRELHQNGDQRRWGSRARHRSNGRVFLKMADDLSREGLTLGPESSLGFPML